MSTPIRIWNRAEGREETEQVYGGAMVDWLYGTKPGQALADGILSRAWISKLYGAYQGARASRHKIVPFIRDFGIRMEEYDEGPFDTFNDFFIRKFRPGARPFETRPDRMPAFAEARYLAFASVTPEQRFPVKGGFLTAEALLGDAREAAAFEGGPLVIARLCPVDYHRYHYPDDGETERSYPVGGLLHSVNPAALRYRGEILATNERRVSLLRTRNFGRLAYIEVGALCVGKIVQTCPENRPFTRGDEKGYFLFGGSTVILLGEAGRWQPDSDLTDRSSRGIESFVRLGEAIAKARDS